MSRTVFRFIVSAGVLLTATVAAAQTPTADSLLCYKAAAAAGSPALATQTALEDRLGTRTVDAKKVMGVCNPVATALLPDVHSVGYSIAQSKSPMQPRFEATSLTAFDQFGAHDLILKKPVALQVPSALAPGSGGAAAVDTSESDHFQCYKAGPAKSSAKFVPPAPITITDDFGALDVTLTKVSRFCTPVSKDGQDPAAPGHTGQLLCYLAKPVDRHAFASQDASIANDGFPAMVVHATSVRELCVPAYLEASTPGDTQTWGDCRRVGQDPDGNPTDDADDTDLPAVTQQCVETSCANGVPVSSMVPLGGACLENGGSFCDGTGECVGPPAGLPRAACSPTWVGDGWCDSGCNTVSYGYDGGDCCLGTCQAGRTYPCGANGYDCVSSGSKTCLFLHGAGVSGPGTFGSSRPSITITGATQPYWGDMASLLRGICTVVYANVDTVSAPWTDTTLQNTYYNQALSVQNSGGVVFAHSMANNILAGACMTQGKCGVRWVSLGGPVRGSLAAEQSAPGYLGIDPSSPALASLSPSFGTPSLSSGVLVSTINSHGLLRAAACGTDAWGSGGTAGLALSLLRASSYGSFKCTQTLLGFCIAWAPVRSDGFVHEDECKDVVPGGTLSTQANAVGFGPAINHQDLTGASGNRGGILDWIRTMAQQF